MEKSAAETAGFNAPRNNYSLLPFLSQLGGLGMSAFQMSRAKNGLDALRRPSAPMAERSPELARRISLAERESQLGNPLLSRERQSATARGMESARQNASQMGGATYAALMQNAALGGASQQRSGLVEDEGLRMQRQGQLDNLIGMRLGENNSANAMASGNYALAMQDYNINRNMLAGDQRQGVTNLSSAFGVIGEDMPEYLSTWRDYRQGKRTVAEEERLAANETTRQGRRMDPLFRDGTAIDGLLQNRNQFNSMAEIDFTSMLFGKTPMTDLDSIFQRVTPKK